MPAPATLRPQLGRPGRRRASRATAKTRRRPSRSASRPAGTRKAANTMLYALSTHESEPRLLPENDVLIAGNATLTIVASRNASSAPSDATSSACRASNRRRAAAPAGAAASATIEIASHPSGTSSRSTQGGAAGTVVLARAMHATYERRLRAAIRRSAYGSFTRLNGAVGPIDYCVTMSTEISTAGLVPLFSSQCVVFRSSGQPTPGPYSVATPSRWSVIVPCRM
jgi:hypothetical protein